MWTASALISILAFSKSVKGLSSWYTEPGGTPAGSVAGDKVRGVNLGGWFILVSFCYHSVFRSWLTDLRKTG
jgi:glucan 1,3-beta-glucosidase